MTIRGAISKSPAPTALLLLLVHFPQNVFAAFSPMTVGGRPAGMGDAFTAMADDVFSLYYNPAGLAELTRPELGAYYSRLFLGLSDGSDISQSFFGYAHPLGSSVSYGTLGVDYTALSLSGLYKEETFAMSYAYQFFNRLNVGTSVKLLRKSIGSDDPATSNAIDSTTGQPFATGQSDPLFSNGQSKSAPAVDLGTQFEVFPHYWIGAAVRNINSPNMALSDSDSDPAPTYTTIGLAKKTYDSSIDVDVGQYQTTQSNLRVAAGGEKWLGPYALRGGLAFGTQDYSWGSFGASYRYKDFQVDYAMNYPIQGVQGTYGNQQVSLIVRFGKEMPNQLEREISEERKARLEAESKTIAMQEELSHLKTEITLLTRQSPQPPVSQNLNPSLMIPPKPSQAPIHKKVSKEEYDNYFQAVQSYMKLRQSGANQVQRLDTVKKILDQYRSSNIDMTDLRSEYTSLNNYIKDQEAKYKLSMNFYKILVNRGAGPVDRKNMIDLIVQKYKSVGFDISEATDEAASIGVAASGKQ